MNKNNNLRAWHIKSNKIYYSCVSVVYGWDLVHGTKNKYTACVKAGVPNKHLGVLGEDVFVDRSIGIKDVRGVEIYENDIVSVPYGLRFMVAWNNEKAAFVFQYIKNPGKEKYYCEFGVWQLPLRVVGSARKLFNEDPEVKDVRTKLPELPGMFCYFQEGADGSVFVEAFRFDKIKHMRIYPDHDPAGIWADVLAGDTDFIIGGEDAERFISEYSAYEFGGTI